MVTLILIAVCAWQGWTGKSLADAATAVAVAAIVGTVGGMIVASNRAGLGLVANDPLTTALLNVAVSCVLGFGAWALARAIRKPGTRNG